MIKKNEIEREIIYFNKNLNQYEGFFPFKLREEIKNPKWISKNKEWIFEKFNKSELKDKKYSIKYLNKSQKKKSEQYNSFFKIIIQEKIFYIWFDIATYDNGGDKSKHRQKISIPNSNKIFRDKFKEEKLKKMFILLLLIFLIYGN